MTIASITDGASNTINSTASTACGAGRCRSVRQWMLLQACGWYGDLLLHLVLSVKSAAEDPVSVYADGLREAFLERRLPSRQANFAMADGSVRSIQDVIGSWPMDNQTATPLGVIHDSNGLIQLTGGARFHVYQALTTRQGGRDRQLRQLLSASNSIIPSAGRGSAAVPEFDDDIAPGRVQRHDLRGEEDGRSTAATAVQRQRLMYPSRRRRPAGGVGAAGGDPPAVAG